MSTTLTTAPASNEVVAMTAQEAFELRQQLRELGWTPVETATDFRKKVVSPEHTGRRTVAYFPEFKNVLGGAMAWSAEGVVDVPAQAAFSEIYAVIGDTTGRWVPIA